MRHTVLRDSIAPPVETATDKERRLVIDFAKALGMRHRKAKIVTDRGGLEGALRAYLLAHSIAYRQEIILTQAMLDDAVRAYNATRQYRLRRERCKQIQLI